MNSRSGWGRTDSDSTVGVSDGPDGVWISSRISSPGAIRRFFRIACNA